MYNSCKQSAGHLNENKMNSFVIKILDGCEKI